MKASKLIVTAALTGVALLSSASIMAKTAKVAVSQIVEHPALDATRQGLVDGLKAKGYEQGKNLDFDYKTAQGNPAIAVQIARQYVGERLMYLSVLQHQRRKRWSRQLVISQLCLPQ
ncbi:ABC transporter substrate-binding protein [Vibrio variabilis]|uniref:ABC transporter substrate-binding protein n=1 Tax=Vibrio variabilis TaxID=990271 RepID=A0ABQ0JEJ7_9VIBR|nr:ABC transporter substrate-binding protein [Vibrio variabilis]